MNIKNFLLHIKYGYKATNSSYIKYLRKKGIRLGNDVKFYSPWTIYIDIQRPWMIEIGNNVHITSGCRVLQHGYDWCVLHKKYGEVLGSCGKVKIGNNVFIGVDTTILKGVSIGDNVIIGAKSLVNKDCLKPGVYAGVPAKYLMSLDEYYQKRKNAQIYEAEELVKEYKKMYGTFPQKKLLREYYWLFENDINDLIPEFVDVLKLEDNYEYSRKVFSNKKMLFNDYNDFLNKMEMKENGK